MSWAGIDSLMILIIQLANEYGRKDQTRIKVLLAALMGSSTVQTSMK